MCIWWSSVLELNVNSLLWTEFMQHGQKLQPSIGCMHAVVSR